MPTYQTKTTGGTPVTRVATLLESALATSTSGGRGSSSPALLREAHAVVAGEEPYLERNTSELLVPRAHAVPEADVRAVWNDLLEMTETTDWVRLKDEGETQFELGCGMCSGPYEAVVLQNLALLHRSRSVLEIGVFTGTATLALALLPSVEEVVALDIEPYLKREVEPYWDRAGVRAKIDFRIAPALESLSALKAARHEPFDLVFIDADKPSYKAYVQAILDGGLLAEDGVILADNTLYKGYPWVTPGAFKEAATPGDVGGVDYERSNRTNNKSKNEATAGIDAFNAFVRNHPDLETVMLPVRDGITIIRRRI